jgi:hypothetical protein
MSQVETKEESFQTSAVGSIKTVHGVVKMADYPVKYKTAGGDTQEGLELIYEDVSRGEVKTQNLPKKLVEMPFRSGLKSAITQLVETGKGTKFTIISEMGDKGFWNIKEIIAGEHVGRAGKVVPGQAAPSASQSGNSYDGSAAAAGQLINIAMAMVSAENTGGFSFESVIQKAESLAMDYNAGKERVKQALYGKPVTASPVLSPDLDMSDASFVTEKATKAAI